MISPPSAALTNFPARRSVVRLLPCRLLVFEGGDYRSETQLSDDMQDLRLNLNQRLDLVVAGTKDRPVMMV